MKRGRARIFSLGINPKMGPVIGLLSDHAMHQIEACLQAVLGNDVGYALLLSDGDVGFTAEVPALPGCYSDGDTLEAAIANIREAAES